jgi:class 3 adenylate cyclase/TolB-like protein/Tfp pilus assembly protein PilF
VPPAATPAPTPTNAPIRRLAAILIADVAGYSRLMERDEAGTHLRLREIRAQVTDPAIERHGGRIVRTAGDGMLVEFASAVEALSAAVEIQREMAARNRDLAPESRIDFRIGINLGDIIIDGNDIAGEGVNLAARLEALADPGGIALSRAVREQVRQVVGVRLTDAGTHRVKNISQPIRVYTVELEGEPRRALARRLQRWRVAWLAGLAAVGGALLAAAALLLRTPVQPPGQSLVVLPFASLAATADEAALAERLTVELTNALTRMSNVIVTARSAAARYAKQPHDLPAIGRALNVRYALEGTLAANGDRLRVIAQLSRTDTGAQLWSGTLETPRGEGATVPIEIVGRLADALRLQLRNAEVARLAHVPAAEADAYTLALRARALLPSTENMAQMDEVRALYERALARDPKHAPALEGLAYTLAVIADRSHDPQQRDALLRRAESLSLQAVALAPNDAEAWSSHSGVLMFADKRVAAMEAIERALTLNPYFSESYAQHGQLLLNEGRFEDALVTLDRGIRLNPVSDAVSVHLNMRCRALLYLGRYAEAIDACQRAMASAPDWPDYMLLAAAYAMAGDASRAAAAREELLRLEPRFTIRWLRDRSGRLAPRAIEARDRYLVTGLRKAGVPD